LTGYFSTDIQAFVAQINTTLIDEVIVNNMLPIAATLSAAHVNVTSILAQSTSIASIQTTFTSAVNQLNTGKERK
jgi:hypothetical protein